MPEKTVAPVQTTVAPGPVPLGAVRTNPFPGAAVPNSAMPARPRKFSVVMPAYNEGRHIAANLRETVKALEGCLPEGAEFEVILVDDGSKDATLLEANSVADSEPRVKVKHLTRNGGKGLALQVGCIYVSGDLVAFLDADLDLHPQQLKNLVEVMDRTGADVVIGSKMHPDSVLDYPLHRRILSWGYYVLIRILFGLPVHDTQTGIKLFTREALSQVMDRIVVKRFAYDIELLVVAHSRGFKIAEAPVTLDFSRQSGRIGARDIFNIMWDTAAIFYRRHILRYYDRPGESRP